jgi:hypothetical protein
MRAGSTSKFVTPDKNMTTLKETGYESGAADWDGSVGTPAVQSSVKNSGTYAAQIDTTAAQEYIAYTVATPSVLVARVYFRFATLPSVDASTLFSTTITSGVRPGLNFNTSTNRFYARWIGASNGNTCAVTISTGTWYRLDLRFDFSANPSKIDFSIEGTAATQSTYAQVATTHTAMRLGVEDVVNMNEYLDDLKITNVSGDYPIGALPGSSVVGPLLGGHLIQPGILQGRLVGRRNA